jgi:phenylpropionate dioxygenase-like ring-hydroxylating dioxygenase large terminal subunit
MNTASITQFKGDESRLKSEVPIAHRLTPEYHQLEVERVFKKSWLIVASALDLPQRGSYLVTDVPPLKASLLVVRGDDDRIRVFHNICRHRGDKLVHEGCGKRRTFTCGFHAWSYSNTGKLIGITDATQFPDFKPEQAPLLEVRSEVWENMVFVNFEPQASESLASWLGDMYEQYRGYTDGRIKIADHRVVLKTNWNLAVNAFCEGYHNLYIHKYTVPDYQGGTSNPNRHRAYIEVARHFGRYSAHGNPNHQPTAAQGAFLKHSLPMFPAFTHFDMDKLPPGVNPSRFKQWAFDIVHMVPNFVFGPQANTHSMMWFWPIDHETTDIRVQRFAFESTKPSDLIAQAHSRVRGREVLREDLATMEASFQALASGAMPNIYLSRQEMLIQNHYRAIDDMVQGV